MSPYEGLDDAAKRAREVADRSLDPADHAKENALAAIQQAERTQAALELLTESGPADGAPPWSEISRPGESEGPLPF